MFGFQIQSSETSALLSLFLNLFILLSYPLNFFVYCGMSSQFRDTFWQLFSFLPRPIRRNPGPNGIVAVKPFPGSNTLRPGSSTLRPSSFPGSEALLNGSSCQGSGSGIHRPTSSSSYPGLTNLRQMSSYPGSTVTLCHTSPAPKTLDNGEASPQLYIRLHDVDILKVKSADVTVV